MTKRKTCLVRFEKFLPNINAHRWVGWTRKGIRFGIWQVQGHISFYVQTGIDYYSYESRQPLPTHYEIMRYYKIKDYIMTHKETRA